MRYESINVSIYYTQLIAGRTHGWRSMPTFRSDKADCISIQSYSIVIHTIHDLLEKPKSRNISRNRGVGGADTS